MQIFEILGLELSQLGAPSLRPPFSLLTPGLALPTPGLALLTPEPDARNWQLELSLQPAPERWIACHSQLRRQISCDFRHPASRQQSGPDEEV